MVNDQSSISKYDYNKYDNYIIHPDLDSFLYYNYNFKD